MTVLVPPAHLDDKFLIRRPPNSIDNFPMRVITPELRFIPKSEPPPKQK